VLDNIFGQDFAQRCCPAGRAAGEGIRQQQHRLGGEVARSGRDVRPRTSDYQPRPVTSSVDLFGVSIRWRARETGSWTPATTPDDSVKTPAPGWGLHTQARADWARRKPTLLFRFSVVFLLRNADRAAAGLLFHAPPRSTRRAIVTACSPPGRVSQKPRRRKGKKIAGWGLRPHTPEEAAAPEPRRPSRPALQRVKGQRTKGQNTSWARRKPT